jgi:diguanylate cyclase (GGDEF)-like protein
MAASDNNPRTNPPGPDGQEWLAATALDERLDEEVKRAERHGTQLSCLLVVIENLEDLALEHGEELREQTLGYVAAALRGELRRFDRVGRPSEQELLIVLPGADGPHGEMVARRVLDRLRAIKVEARGARRPLRVSVGLAAWRDGVGAEELLARTRAASQVANGEEASTGAAGATPGARETTEPATARPLGRH